MRTTLGALICALGLLSAGCAADGDDASEREPAEAEAQPLQTAYDECFPGVEDAISEFETEQVAGDFLRVEDEGASLIVSTPSPGGDIMSTMAFTATSCVLEETGAPATVVEKMGTTSALSGSQSDEYDGIEVTWAYSGGTGGGFSATFEVS